MGLPSILAELKVAQDEFRLLERGAATAIFCQQVNKALDRVVREAAGADFDHLVVGILIVIGSFNDLLPQLVDGPLLRQLLDKLFGQCARVVLDIKWQQCDKEAPSQHKFRQCLSTCHQVMGPRGFTRFSVLQTLMDNPWTDPVLTLVMGSEDDSEDGEGLAYIQAQDPEILKLRVELMQQENCDDFALNLCTWCLKHPALTGDFLLKKTQFILLHRLGNIDRLQEECQAMSMEDSLGLIHSLLEKEEHRELCTMLAQTFLVQNWIKPSDNDTKKELLQLWIGLQYQADQDQDRFISSLWSVAKVSHSTQQLMLIIDAVRQQCGDTFLQFCLDLCVFAINVDKGCWEKLKESYTSGPNEELQARKRDMAKVCEKIIHIVAHVSPKVSFCCALTAFSMVPTDQSLQAVVAAHHRRTLSDTSIKARCCSNCATDKGECLSARNSDKMSREVNVATLYEVERLCGTLRPSYLSSESDFSVLYSMCKQYLMKEKGEAVKSALVRRKSAQSMSPAMASPDSSSVSSGGVNSPQPSMHQTLLQAQTSVPDVQSLLPGVQSLAPVPSALSVQSSMPGVQASVPVQASLPAVETFVPAVRSSLPAHSSLPVESSLPIQSSAPVIQSTLPAVQTLVRAKSSLGASSSIPAQPSLYGQPALAAQSTLPVKSPLPSVLSFVSGQSSLGVPSSIPGQSSLAVPSSIPGQPSLPLQSSSIPVPTPLPPVSSVSAQSVEDIQHRVQGLLSPYSSQNTRIASSHTVRDSGLVGLATEGTMREGTRFQGTMNQRTVNQGTVMREGTMREGTRIEVAMKQGTVREGTLREGTLREGTLIEGTVREGTLREGTLREGTLREGTLIEGTLREGTLREGTLREGTMNQGTLKEGTTSSVPGGLEPDVLSVSAVQQLVLKQLSTDMVQALLSLIESGHTSPAHINQMLAKNPALTIQALQGLISSQVKKPSADSANANTKTSASFPTHRQQQQLQQETRNNYVAAQHVSQHKLPPQQKFQLPLSTSLSQHAQPQVQQVHTIQQTKPHQTQSQVSDAAYKLHPSSVRSESQAGAQELQSSLQPSRVLMHTQTGLRQQTPQLIPRRHTLGQTSGVSAVSQAVPIRPRLEDYIKSSLGQPQTVQSKPGPLQSLVPSVSHLLQVTSKGELQASQPLHLMALQPPATVQSSKASSQVRVGSTSHVLTHLSGGNIMSMQQQPHLVRVPASSLPFPHIPKPSSKPAKLIPKAPGPLSGSASSSQTSTGGSSSDVLIGNRHYSINNLLFTGEQQSSAISISLPDRLPEISVDSISDTLRALNDTSTVSAQVTPGVASLPVQHSVSQPSLPPQPLHRPPPETSPTSLQFVRPVLSKAPRQQHGGKPSPKPSVSLVSGPASLSPDLRATLAAFSMPSRSVHPQEQPLPSFSSLFSTNRSPLPAPATSPRAASPQAAALKPSSTPVPGLDPSYSVSGSPAGGVSLPAPSLAPQPDTQPTLSKKKEKTTGTGSRAKKGEGGTTKGSKKGKKGVWEDKEEMMRLLKQAMSINVTKKDEGEDPGPTHHIIPSLPTKHVSPASAWMVDFPAPSTTTDLPLASQSKGVASVSTSPYPISASSLPPYTTSHHARGPGPLPSPAPLPSHTSLPHPLSRAVAPGLLSSVSSSGANVQLTSVNSQFSDPLHLNRTLNRSEESLSGSSGLLHVPSSSLPSPSVLKSGLSSVDLFTRQNVVNASASSAVYRSESVVNAIASSRMYSPQIEVNANPKSSVYGSPIAVNASTSSTLYSSQSALNTSSKSSVYGPAVVNPVCSCEVPESSNKSYPPHLYSNTRQTFDGPLAPPATPHSSKGGLIVWNTSLYSSGKVSLPQPAGSPSVADMSPSPARSWSPPIAPNIVSDARRTAATSPVGSPLVYNANTPVSGLAPSVAHSSPSVSVPDGASTSVYDMMPNMDSLTMAGGEMPERLLAGGDRAFATYRCIICSKAFMTLDALKIHVKHSCKPESDVPPGEESEASSKPPAPAGLETSTVFQCMRCYELCISEEGIRAHKQVCSKTPKPKPKPKSRAKPKQPKSEEEQATEARVMELLNKCLGENREKLVQETEAERLKKQQAKKKPPKKRKAEGDGGQTKASPKPKKTKKDMTDSSGPEGGSGSVAPQMPLNIPSTLGTEIGVNTGVVPPTLNPQSAVSSGLPDTAQPGPHCGLPAPEVAPSLGDLGSPLHPVNHPMPNMGQSFALEGGHGMPPDSQPVSNPLSTSASGFPTPTPQVTQWTPAGSEHVHTLSGNVPTTSFTEPPAQPDAVKGDKPKPKRKYYPKKKKPKDDATAPSDTPSDPNTAAKEPGKELKPKKPRVEKQPKSPKPKKAPQPPRPRFKKLSGSGGRSFFKCLNCGQTLCSIENFGDHWVECIKKKPLSPPKPKRVTKDKKTKMNNGEKVSTTVYTSKESVDAIIDRVAAGLFSTDSPPPELSTEYLTAETTGEIDLAQTSGTTQGQDMSNIHTHNPDVQRMLMFTDVENELPLQVGNDGLTEVVTHLKDINPEALDTNLGECSPQTLMHQSDGVPVSQTLQSRDMLNLSSSHETHLLQLNECQTSQTVLSSDVLTSQPRQSNPQTQGSDLIGPKTVTHTDLFSQTYPPVSQDGTGTSGMLTSQAALVPYSQTTVSAESESGAHNRTQGDSINTEDNINIAERRETEPHMIENSSNNEFCVNASPQTNSTDKQSSSNTGFSAIASEAVLETRGRNLTKSSSVDQSGSITPEASGAARERKRSNSVPKSASSQLEMSGNNTTFDTTTHWLSRPRSLSPSLEEKITEETTPHEHSEERPDTTSPLKKDNKKSKAKCEGGQDKHRRVSKSESPKRGVKPAGDARVVTTPQGMKEVTHCKLCDRGFSRHWVLLRHIATQHVKPVVQKVDDGHVYLCPFCLELFSQCFLFKSHVMSHPDTLLRLFLDLDTSSFEQTSTTDDSGNKNQMSVALTNNNSAPPDPATSVINSQDNTQATKTVDKTEPKTSESDKTAVVASVRKSGRKEAGKKLKLFNNLLKASSWRYAELSTGIEKRKESSEKKVSKTKSKEIRKVWDEEYYCHVCERMFSRYDVLVQHFATQHVRPFTLTQSGPSAIYRCHYCQQNFNPRAKYMCHVITHHQAIVQKFRQTFRPKNHLSEPTLSQEPSNKGAEDVSKLDESPKPNNELGADNSNLDPSCEHVDKNSDDIKEVDSQQRSRRSKKDLNADNCQEQGGKLADIASKMDKPHKLSSKGKKTLIALRSRRGLFTELSKKKPRDKTGKFLPLNRKTKTQSSNNQSTINKQSQLQNERVKESLREKIKLRPSSKKSTEESKAESKLEAVTAAREGKKTEAVSSETDPESCGQTGSQTELDQADTKTHPDVQPNQPESTLDDGKISQSDQAVTFPKQTRTRSKTSKTDDNKSNKNDENQNENFTSDQNSCEKKEETAKKDVDKLDETGAKSEEKAEDSVVCVSEDNTKRTRAAKSKAAEVKPVHGKEEKKDIDMHVENVIRTRSRGKSSNKLKPNNLKDESKKSDLKEESKETSVEVPQGNYGSKDTVVEPKASKTDIESSVSARTETDNKVKSDKIDKIPDNGIVIETDRKGPLSDKEMVIETCSKPESDSKDQILDKETVKETDAQDKSNTKDQILTKEMFKHVEQSASNQSKLTENAPSCTEQDPVHNNQEKQSLIVQHLKNNLPPIASHSSPSPSSALQKTSFLDTFKSFVSTRSSDTFQRKQPKRRNRYSNSREQKPSTKETDCTKEGNDGSAHALDQTSQSVPATDMLQTLDTGDKATALNAKTPENTDSSRAETESSSTMSKRLETRLSNACDGREHDSMLSVGDDGKDVSSSGTVAALNSDTRDMKTGPQEKDLTSASEIMATGLPPQSSIKTDTKSPQSIGENVNQSVSESLSSVCSSDSDVCTLEGAVDRAISQALGMDQACKLKSPILPRLLQQPIHVHSTQGLNTDTGHVPTTSGGISEKPVSSGVAVKACGSMESVSKMQRLQQASEGLRADAQHSQLSAEPCFQTQSRPERSEKEIFASVEHQIPEAEIMSANTKTSEGDKPSVTSVDHPIPASYEAGNKETDDSTGKETISSDLLSIESTVPHQPVQKDGKSVSKDSESMHDEINRDEQLETILQKAESPLSPSSAVRTNPVKGEDGSNKKCVNNVDKVGMHAGAAAGVAVHSDIACYDDEDDADDGWNTEEDDIKLCVSEASQESAALPQGNSCTSQSHSHAPTVISTNSELATTSADEGFKHEDSKPLSSVSHPERSSTSPVHAVKEWATNSAIKTLNSTETQVVDGTSNADTSKRGRVSDASDPDNDLPELCIEHDPHGVILTKREPDIKTVQLDKTWQNKKPVVCSVGGTNKASTKTAPYPVKKPGTDVVLSTVVGEYEVTIKQLMRKNDETEDRYKTRVVTETVTEQGTKVEPEVVVAPVRKPMLGVKPLRNVHQAEPFIWDEEGDEDRQKRARNERSLKAFQQKVQVAPFSWEADSHEMKALGSTENDVGQSSKTSPEAEQATTVQQSEVSESVKITPEKGECKDGSSRDTKSTDNADKQNSSTSDNSTSCNQDSDNTPDKTIPAVTQPESLEIKPRDVANSKDYENNDQNKSDTVKEAPHKSESEKRTESESVSRVSTRRSKIIKPDGISGKSEPSTTGDNDVKEGSNIMGDEENIKSRSRSTKRGREITRSTTLRSGSADETVVTKRPRNSTSRTRNVTPTLQKTLRKSQSFDSEGSHSLKDADDTTASPKTDPQLTDNIHAEVNAVSITSEHSVEKKIDSKSKPDFVRLKSRIRSQPVKQNVPSPSVNSKVSSPVSDVKVKNISPAGKMPAVNSVRSSRLRKLAVEKQQKSKPSMDEKLSGPNKKTNPVKKTHDQNCEKTGIKHKSVEDTQHPVKTSQPDNATLPTNDCKVLRSRDITPDKVTSNPNTPDQALSLESQVSGRSRCRRTSSASNQSKTGDDHAHGAVPLSVEHSTDSASSDTLTLLNDSDSISKPQAARPTRTNRNKERKPTLADAVKEISQSVQQPQSDVAVVPLQKESGTLTDPPHTDPSELKSPDKPVPVHNSQPMLGAMVRRRQHPVNWQKAVSRSNSKRQVLSPQTPQFEIIRVEPVKDGPASDHRRTRSSDRDTDPSPRTVHTRVSADVLKPDLNKRASPKGDSEQKWSINRRITPAQVRKRMGDQRFPFSFKRARRKTDTK